MDVCTPPTHPHPQPSLRLSRSHIDSKGAAGSSNLILPPLSLTLTTVPPKPLSPAPEQRPGPRKQAVNQGDTDVPPLPTVLGSRSRRGQKLQPPVQPPEGGKGGAGHEEPRGRHGLAGRLGPDPSLGLLSSQPRHIQRPLRGRRTSFPARLRPWTPPPAPPTESALTFPGLVHAPNPRLGGDWSSRGATAPRATATDRVPP